jgi:hypothetical protein
MLWAFGRRRLRHVARLGAEGSREDSDHEYQYNDPAQRKHIHILRRELCRVNEEVEEGSLSQRERVLRSSG